MIPSLLVASNAAGIVWADCGGWLPGLLASFWLPAALWSCLRLWTRIQIDRPNVHHRPVPDGRVGRTGCILLLAFFSFLTGFDRLDSKLSQARSDRLLAEAGRSDGARLAEARVGARRSGRWGDEVELVGVRATDAGRRLPRRLLLRLGREEPSSDRRGGSRAERLLWPGRSVRVGLRVMPLLATRNPGTPDREHRYARRGFAASARLVKSSWVLGMSDAPSAGRIRMPSAADWRAGWRRRVAERFDARRESAPLVRALAIGDRRGISVETRDAFRRLGLSHLLAISGLHVGFVAGLAGWFFARSTASFGSGPRRVEVFDRALVVACFAAALYAWMAEAGISVERAALLFWLYALCRLFLRMIAPHRALAWVALAVLTSDPAALFDVGAHLSFSACAALIAAGRGLTAPSVGSDSGAGESIWVRASNAMHSTLRASLIVSLGLAPLLAQHGLSMSVLSPLFNVVAIPWTGLIVLPASLIAVVMFEFLPISLIRALCWPARALEIGALRVAESMPEPSDEARLSMLLAVAMIALAFWSIRRSRWRVAILVWTGVSLAGLSPFPMERIITPRPRVIFFDVGQGDAALVQGREGVVLVDTGSGPSNGSGGGGLARALRAADVDRIDVLVLTHGDLDHRAGLLRVLNTFMVDELWLPGSEIGDPGLRAAAQAARQRGTRVSWRTDSDVGSSSKRGDLEIDVLWPPAGERIISSSRNDNSMVLRIVVEGKIFLFAADIGAGVERELMKEEERIAADVLKVAHHGSAGSSSASFLARVSPEVAVVSAPCDPTRGLPNGQVLERLHRSGASLFWTGRDGAVIVSPRHADIIRIESWGSRRDCTPR